MDDIGLSVSDLQYVHHRSAAVKAHLNEEMGTLKLRAQTALGVGMGQLVDASGDALSMIEDAGLRNGESLVAVLAMDLW